MAIFLIVLFIALMIAGWVYSHQAEKKRRLTMQLTASQLGLQFFEGKDHSLDEQFHFLDKLCQGDNRYGFNVIKGTYRGHRIQAFDYHYETETTDSKGNTTTHHHHISFFLLNFDGNFPELLISREGWFSKFTQFMGFEDIDFESAEFSRAFLVKSRNKKFAYDICHARMIDYMLDNRDLNIEIERNCLTLFFERRLKPEQIRPNFDRLIEVREMFPNYLMVKS